MSENKESSRYYSGQRNYDYETKNHPMSENEWRALVADDFQKLVDDNKDCSAVYIFHDRDRYDKDDKDADKAGQLKPLHCHFIVTYGYNKKRSTAMNELNISRDQNLRKLHKSKKGGKDTIFNAMRYLTHRTTGAMMTKKYPYDTSNLNFVGFPEEALEDKGTLYSSLIEGDLALGKGNSVTATIEQHEEQAIIGQIYNEIETDKLPLEQAKKRVINMYNDLLLSKLDDKETVAFQEKIDKGNPSAFAYPAYLFATNEKKFKRAYERHVGRVAREMGHKNRNLHNIYFQGAGGTGKSQLAKAMGFIATKNRPLHFSAVTDGTTTPDPVGNYHGQNASVFNELSGQQMGMRKFCNTFDQNQYAPFPSRNNDVDWVAHYAMITNSDSLNDWINNMLQYNTGGSKYMKNGSDEIDVNKEVYKKDHFQIARRFNGYVSLQPSSKYDDGCEVLVYKFVKDRNSQMPFVPVISQPIICKDVTNINDCMAVSAKIMKLLDLIDDQTLLSAVDFNGQKLITAEELKMFNSDNAVQRYYDDQRNKFKQYFGDNDQNNDEVVDDDVDLF